MPSDAGRVRLANADDLPALIELDQIAAGGDVDRVSAIASAIETRQCLVLAGGPRVAGYVVSAPKGFLGHDFVELLMVDPRDRRAGAGRTLLRAAVSGAATSRVFTSTNRSNGPMRALLDSERWKYSGQLEGLDEDDPEVVYFIDAELYVGAHRSPCEA